MMTADELLAEPTRLELLQLALDATGDCQEAYARLFCAVTQRDALIRGLLLLKLELANEEYAHGEMPTRVVLAYIEESVKQACERESAAALRLVAR